MKKLLAQLSPQKLNLTFSAWDDSTITVRQGDGEDVLVGEWNDRPAEHIHQAISKYLNRPLADLYNEKIIGKLRPRKERHGRARQNSRNPGSLGNKKIF
jgi:hypothetical protein